MLCCLQLYFTYDLSYYFDVISAVYNNYFIETIFQHKIIGPGVSFVNNKEIEQLVAHFQFVCAQQRASHKVGEIPMLNQSVDQTMMGCTPLTFKGEGGVGSLTSILAKL